MGKVGAQFLQGIRNLFGKSESNQTPSNLDIIQFNSATQQWELVSGVVGNAVQTSSNVGSGEGVALPRVGDDLPFRSLTTTSKISLTGSATEIEIDIGTLLISDIQGLQTALDNLEPPFLISDITGLQTALDSKLESPIDISDVTNLQTDLDSKIETLTNVGSGVGISKPKVLQNVDLKSILAGTGITINSLTDEIEIVNSQPPQVGNRKLFSIERQISVYPTDNDNIGLIMVGAGNFSDEGIISEFFDVDGYYLEFRVTVDMGAGDGGFFCIDSVRREHNFDITVKFRVPATADRMFWSGFFTDDPKNEDNPLPEHIGLRLSTEATNVNFVLSHSDGVTQAETQLALADTAIHTIRILADESNSKFQYSFDGGALVDVTTNIPASGTNLDIFDEIYAQAGGILPHFDFWYLDGRSDK
jgi:hypothetical protein